MLFCFFLICIMYMIKWKNNFMASIIQSTNIYKNLSPGSGDIAANKQTALMELTFWRRETDSIQVNKEENCVSW